MSAVADRIRLLSPAKRALLEKRFAIPRRPLGEPVQASWAQHRLWLLSQLETTGAALHICKALRLCGHVRVDALRTALRAVVQRHEALRTNFSIRDGKLYQIVSTHSAELNLVTYTGNFDEEIQRPFDLACDPMLRATLFQLNDDESVLLLVIHHIAADGWSMDILSRELCSIYNDESAVLPELTIQYSDYSEWQRGRLEGGTATRHLDYWKGELEGAPREMAWPLRQTSAAAGTHETLVLDSELTLDLRQLGQRHGATLFMTLCTAFHVLLARYTGQDDIVFGTPLANRSAPETEALIGCFFNVLPLRIRSSGNRTFTELLLHVKDSALNLYAHQELPFELLLPQLQQSSIFQVLFAHSRAHDESWQFAGLETSPIQLDNRTSLFDLTLSAIEYDDRLRLKLECNRDLGALLGPFETLLRNIAANPEERVSRIPLLTHSERETMLHAWNDTAVAWESEQRIEQAFELQVGRTPQHCAAVFEGARITYDELNRRANRLARYLQGQGVKIGDLVGVMLPPSLDTFVALLATLKAGAIYLPLDTAYPKDRLDWMIRDSGVSMVLTSVISGAGSSDNLDLELSLDSPAYAMYTSGSTGTPKAVLGLHRGAMNRFRWMWRHFPFTPDDVPCVKTSVSFVDSVWEIFGALLQGVTSVVMPQSAAGDPYLLMDELARYRVTRIVLVPSLLGTLLDCGMTQARLPLLRMFVVSGETLPAALAERFRLAMPDAILINLYGSSEVSADVTCHVVGDLQGLDRIPIGRPIANTQTYVLDREMQPVQVGWPGALYVAGDNLAQGYLNDPELTSAKFIADPFRPGNTMFKTGDNARFLPGGELDYLGRSDRQVKIRGVRIELEEVEAALNQHEGVRQAVVTVEEDRLVAYITAKSQDLDLRAFAANTLPAAMVPSRFVIVNQIPLTPNGKINRLALPMQALERTLTEIWKDILNVKEVGLADNFFDVGGHSLLAVRLISEIQQRTGVLLPVANVFVAPTIEQLSACIRQRGESTTAVKATRHPFFWISRYSIHHGLAAAEFPFHALETRDAEPPGEIANLQNIAARHLEKLRQVQPRGPYSLGGYCVDCVVTFELANQLHAAGEDIASLVLVDPVDIGLCRGAFPEAHTFLYWLHRRMLRGAHYIKRINDTPPKDRAAFLLQRKAMVLDIVSQKLRRFVYRPEPANLEPSFEHRRTAMVAAIENYVPQKYSGQITLVRPAGRPQGLFEDANSRWASLAAGGAEIHLTPGRHTDMFSAPNVAPLAEWLSRKHADAGQDPHGVRET